MGYSFNGVCYASLSNASSAHCSTFPLVTDGVQYSCVRSADTAPVLVQTRLSDNTLSSEYLLSVKYPECTESVLVPGPWSLSIMDGLQISSAILVVWALAWGIRTISRLLFDSYSSKDDSP